MRDRCRYPARCTLFYCSCIVAMGSSLTTGCSLLGFGIGSTIYSGPEWDTLAAAGAIYLVEGDDVSIRFLELDTIDGSFVKRDTLSLEAYTPLYQVSIRDLRTDLILPQLGDSMTIVPRSDRNEVRTTFLGFSEQGVLVAAPSVPGGGLVRLTQVRYFALDGGSILEADQINALLKEGNIPFRTGIWVEVGGVRERFSLEDVETILVQNESNARYFLGGIGLVIDVVVITTIDDWDFFDKPR